MKIVVILFCFFTSVTAIADIDRSGGNKLKGKWVIEIQNLKRDVITKMTVRFSDQKADSCLGGDWHQIVVESHSTLDEKFFPINDPLSYKLKGSRIIIGRNEICDAYIHLDGQFRDTKAIGDYISFGWTSETLGYFSLIQDAKKDS